MPPGAPPRWGGRARTKTTFGDAFTPEGGKTEAAQAGPAGPGTPGAPRAGPAEPPHLTGAVCGRPRSVHIHLKRPLPRCPPLFLLSPVCPLPALPPDLATFRSAQHPETKRCLLASAPPAASRRDEAPRPLPHSRSSTHTPGMPAAVHPATTTSMPLRMPPSTQRFSPQSCPGSPRRTGTRGGRIYAPGPRSTTSPRGRTAAITSCSSASTGAG